MSRRHTVLIVDDEAFVRESLVDLLESEGYATLTAAGAMDALQVLECQVVDVVVTDLRMPRGDGIAFLERVRELGMQVPIVVLTGVGTVVDAVAAMKSGAHDFIQKPVDPEQFGLVVRRALEHRALLSEVSFLRHTVEDLRGETTMVGESAALAEVRALIAQVAPSDATVLVTGESGTGKELAAAEVHRLSSRASRNLVRVNCAAISETLFESEFFGHRRGAFTGAVADRVGRFAEAEGGTLVLDEIGTLRPEMQAKLLRVLETGEYQVIGESRTRVADVRVVAMTNEDLTRNVKAGRFRADLYFRLNVFPIPMPPLRRRLEDIELLARHFLERARNSCRNLSGAGVELDTEAIEVLRAYPWPGNVRELRNVIERAVILAGRDPPDAALLRSILGSHADLEALADDDDLNIRRRVEALERRLISLALERSRGRKRKASTMLGIDPKNLSYYIRKHGLSGEPGDESGPAP